MQCTCACNNNVHSMTNMTPPKTPSFHALDTKEPYTAGDCADFRFPPKVDEISAA